MFSCCFGTKAIEPNARKSIKVKSDEATALAVQGLKKDTQNMLKDRQAASDLARLQEKFHDMINSEEGSAEETVSKSQLKSSFKSLGIEVEPHIFEKIYELMDADNNGSIDEQEFAVTMCYFLHHDKSASDKVELAYKLFDTNHDGTISKREFSDMISTVIGGRLDTILRIQKGKEIFTNYLKTELCEELLTFYEEMKQVKSQYGSTAIPMDKADALFEQYIEVDSELQVNISSDEREEIRDRIKGAKDDGKDTVPYEIFANAVNESKDLLENGSLMRFRQKIKQEPYDLFASVAWEELGLDEEDTISLENFKKWTSMTPGLFDFLDEVSEEVFGAIRK